MFLWALPSYLITIYALTISAFHVNKQFEQGLKLKTGLFLAVSLLMAHFQSYTRFVSANPLFLVTVALLPVRWGNMLLLAYNVAGVVFFSNGYVWT